MFKNVIIMGKRGTMKMKKYTTSDRLKQIMSEKGLRQVDILEKLKPFCIQYDEKISKSHLSQWVSGINEPNQRKLVLLAKALNVSEVWLMGYDVPMQSAKFENPEQKARIVSYYEKLNNTSKEELMNYMQYLLSKQDKEDGKNGE